VGESGRTRDVLVGREAAVEPLSRESEKGKALCPVKSVLDRT